MFELVKKWIHDYPHGKIWAKRKPRRSGANFLWLIECEAYEASVSLLVMVSNRLETFQPKPLVVNEESCPLMRWLSG
jgi:hypothetical protein